MKLAAKADHNNENIKKQVLTKLIQ